MALSDGDRAWLEGKFQAQKTDSDRMWKAIGKTREDVAAHHAAPCKDVAVCERRHHNPARFWGMCAAIASVATGAATALVWLIDLLTSRAKP